MRLAPRGLYCGAFCLLAIILNHLAGCAPAQLQPEGAAINTPLDLTYDKPAAVGTSVHATAEVC
jgi:hypothetical protein